MAGRAVSVTGLRQLPLPDRRSCSLSACAVPQDPPATDFAETAMVSSQMLPTLCLVRHGETAWTISGQHTGHTDIPLTEHGEQAARELGPRLRDWNFVQVFTSPLQRARRTAELAGFGAAAIADADLMEWDYGACEGRRTADIRAERPGWKLFDDGCPGGETLDAIGARADRVIGRIRACPGDVLVFAHRDILRVLVARWIGLAAAGRPLFRPRASLDQSARLRPRARRADHPPDERRPSFLAPRSPPPARRRS